MKIWSNLKNNHNNYFSIYHHYLERNSYLHFFRETLRAETWMRSLLTKTPKSFEGKRFRLHEKDIFVEVASNIAKLLDSPEGSQ